MVVSEVARCESTFLRERLRQWHFQLLLDGDLLDLERFDSDEYVRRRDRRWARFVALTNDPTGALASFLDDATSESGWFHAPSVPSRQTLAAELVDVLGELRMMHQHRHATRIAHSDKTRGRVALAEKMRWSEALATTSLPLAVLFAVATFVALSRTDGDVPTVLGTIALTFAVISAATRAFRAGETLPAEVDLYEDYAKHVDKLRRDFFAPGLTIEERWGILVDLEFESIRELRAFLREKTPRSLPALGSVRRPSRVGSAPVATRGASA